VPVEHSKIKRSGSYFENTNMKPGQREEAVEIVVSLVDNRGTYYYANDF
jgi:hypothetical protein